MDDHCATTLVVIDDESEILSATVRVLERAGYAVIPGVNAAQARELTQRHRPAMLLLDVNLPDGSGVDVARELKSDPDLAGLFVILLSGFSISGADQAKGLASGLADAYIARPISNVELLARIEALLRLRTAQVELLEHRHHLEELVLARTAELAQAKDSAEAASRAKSMFLATMSHELRTPMNAIMGMTDLALTRATDPQQKGWLGKSKEAAGRLLGMIDEVLDFSRIEAQELTLEEQEFSLSQVIDSAVGAQDGAAAAKGLALVASVDPALPEFLRGDGPVLEKILANLVSNAVKFADHGQVAVRATGTPEGRSSLLLRIEVADQGIGIRLEDQAKLFQAFTQVDGSTTRRHGGIGLGLVVAKRLALLMGGDIGVESTYGHGSTFWLTARLHYGSASAARPGGPSAGRSLLKKG